ncbi:BrnT family toxin [Pandoraea communis]|nr:hypothetical protein [Pandoraea communis]
MDISFDPAKSDRNVQERGLPFTMAQDFEWDSAVAFMPRAEKIHVVSLRKANPREVKRYAQT